MQAILLLRADTTLIIPRTTLVTVKKKKTNMNTEQKGMEDIRLSHTFTRPVFIKHLLCKMLSNYICPITHFHFISFRPFELTSTLFFNQVLTL